MSLELDLKRKIYEDYRDKKIDYERFKELNAEVSSSNAKEQMNSISKPEGEQKCKIYEDYRDRKISYEKFKELIAMVDADDSKIDDECPKNEPPRQSNIPAKLDHLPRNKEVEKVEKEMMNNLIFEFKGGLKNMFFADVLSPNAGLFSKIDILFVYDDKMIIRREGIGNFFSHGLKGDKTIYFADITSLQMKKAGSIDGYLQFSLPGGNENTMGVFAAGRDENTILFTKDKNDEAQKIHDYINKRLKEIKNPTKSPQSLSPSDAIRKLKGLLDDEIITKEEFDAKKKQLLNL